MPSRPVVVSYHAVSDTWPSALAIRTNVLREQLGRLAHAGFVGMTISEAERRRRDGTLPPRSLAVTFDDGYRSTLEAKPVLDELGFPATVFVVSDFIGSEAPMAWPGIERWGRSDHAHELRALEWSDLERLVEAGWEVGSHTASHPLLTVLPPDALESDSCASGGSTVSSGCEAVCHANSHPASTSRSRSDHSSARSSCAWSLRPHLSMPGQAIGASEPMKSLTTKTVAGKPKLVEHRLRLECRPVAVVEGHGEGRAVTSRGSQFRLGDGNLDEARVCQAPSCSRRTFVRIASAEGHMSLTAW